jgi:hypothetical protein
MKFDGLTEIFERLPLGLHFAEATGERGNMHGKAILFAGLKDHGDFDHGTILTLCKVGRHAGPLYGQWINARTSPPTFSVRALRSLITPRGVLRIWIPMPPRIGFSSL